MTLNELNPKWENWGEGYLSFTCPKCKDPGENGEQRIEIPLPPHPKAWTFTTTGNLNPALTEADFDHLTLSPSVDYKHRYLGEVPGCAAHFYVRNGQIEML